MEEKKTIFLIYFKYGNKFKISVEVKKQEGKHKWSKITVR